MSVYETKHELYRSYCQELNLYRKEQISDDTAWRECEKYISSKECSWHNIYDEETKELVGFFIAGKEGTNKHPDAVRSVAEAFILPHYRKRGLMTKYVTEYMGRHPGVYSLLVLNKNVAASEFWEHMFKKAGYVPCELDDKFLEGTELHLLAFRPAK